MEYEYILLGAAIVMSGYYSGLEMGVYCLNKVRLQHRTDRGWRTARIMTRHLKNPQMLICTILVGNNIVNFIAAGLFTDVLERKTSFERPEFIATIILSPFLLVFAEYTPKNLFRQKSDSLLYSLAPTLDISRKLFYPIVILLKLISKVVFLFFKKQASDDYTFLSPRRLMYFFSEGAEEGSLSGYQNLMTRNILRLGRVRVKRVMIHLKDITSIPYNIDIEKLPVIISKKPYSRLPIYNGQKDNIVGIINLLEFLSSYKPGLNINRFTGKVIYLDQNMPVDDALFTLQKSKQRMGIVVDAKKRAMGIVTIKDLVEEIVGELAVW